MQLLYLRYLASCPIEEIQCVTQTRRRVRCSAKVLGPGALLAGGGLAERSPDLDSGHMSEPEQNPNKAALEIVLASPGSDQPRKKRRRNKQKVEGHATPAPAQAASEPQADRRDLVVCCYALLRKPVREQGTTNQCPNCKTLYTVTRQTPRDDPPSEKLLGL